MARIELWNGDICELEVDAIVNAANTSLWMSTGVGGAIKRAGGDAIEFAARFVIHAVSLDRDRRTSGQSIERAVRSTFARARELGVTSLAFPALGTGVGGFPLDEAARIMVDVAHDELPKSPAIDYLIFALRGVAAYRQFEIALAHGEGAAQDAPNLASSSASTATAGGA